jgi:hypothetical protein
VEAIVEGRQPPDLTEERKTRIERRNFRGRRDVLAERVSRGALCSPKIYSWFTEGFNTAGLKDAKRCLTS